MTLLNVNFSEITGKIKPMHAINNGPVVDASDRFWDKAMEIGLPYARTHDTGGSYGGGCFVDIANIFRNFDADEDDPLSYDFAFTDWLIKRMINSGIKPFYRLGCTIENYQYIKAYNIYPPKDNLKWAKICYHIILHYNCGWANGFHYNIEHWEIWNEPDNQMEVENNPMWKGTMKEYFKLYEVTSNYLKDKFPDLKIGGYASCGFYNILEAKPLETAHVSTRTEWFIHFFKEFLKYISSPEHKSPLDFFSWHSYAGLKENLKFASYCKDTLNEYGFTKTETYLDEWNPGINYRGTVTDASNILGMMLGLNDSPLDMLMYYDGQPTSRYCGLWSYETGKILKGYYAFLYFNELYKLKDEAFSSCDDEDVITLSATSDTDNKIAISNMSDNIKTISINMSGVSGQTISVRMVTSEYDDVEFTLDFNNKINIQLDERAIALISVK